MSWNADLQELPLCYWLRRAEETLTDRLKDGLRGYGLNLLHWQVFNLLCGMSDGTASDLDVSTAKTTFVDARELNGIIQDLVRLGWLAHGDATGRFLPPLGLTEAGREGRRALLRLSAEVHDRSQSGVSEEEYRTTVSTLRRMVHNLLPV